MKRDILSKINEITNQKSRVDEMTDDENPKYMWNGVNTKIVVGVATGKIDAKEYAKAELVNRGFGKKGEWIGFAEAKKLWNPKVK